MTKEGEEVPAQEEERRGGGSRRKEGRERGAGVPGSRLCSGPRCAENAPGGPGTSLVLKSSGAPAPSQAVSSDSEASAPRTSFPEPSSPRGACFSS